MPIEFINIWNKPEYYPAVIKYWEKLGALPKNVKAADRAKELVMMAKKDDQVIGVTTCYPSQIKFLNNKFFFAFRILIHPHHRIPGLSHKLTAMTRDFMESQFLEEKTERIGLIAFVEKKEVIQYLSQAVWKSSGFIFIGNTADGRQIRIYYFEGAKIL